MKQELLQELAVELAGILRDNKSLTLDQLFTRCRDGVSWDDVGDAARLLCAMDSAIANGGVFHFKAMPDFTNTPAKREAKPEAELPSPANESPTGTPEELARFDAHFARPVHPDSVDHETVQQGKTWAEAAKEVCDEIFAPYDFKFVAEPVNKAMPDPIQPDPLILKLCDQHRLTYRVGIVMEYLCQGDYGSAMNELREIVEKYQ